MQRMIFPVIPPLPEVGGVAQNYGPKSMMKWIFSQDEICRKILGSLNVELQLSTSTCAPHVFALWRNGLWKWHPILWPCFFCTRATGIHEKSHHYIIASTAGHVKSADVFQRGSLTTISGKDVFCIFYFCPIGPQVVGCFGAMAQMRDVLAQPWKGWDINFHSSLFSQCRTGVLTI